MKWTRAVALFVFTSCAAMAQEQSLPLERIRLPPGFQIELLARVPNAREMAWGEKGTLFVGSSSEGKVYALSLRDGAKPQLHVVASGLQMPVGVAFRNGALYVSAVSRIVRLDDIEAHLTDPPKPVVVSQAFPSDTGHGWKFIAFGPDGMLYVPVGAPCNICEPDPDRYANINRMKPDGSGLEVFARGIRNSVGFDWDPRTKELWFTDNGRDWMGDEMPSDELNHAPRPGMHFGYPYCHQGDTTDPEFGRKHPCSEFTPPVAKLGPHVASLGMRFYTGNQFPAEYRNAIFIAEHGSWNRSKKIGYRVVAVKGQNGKVAANDVFAEGWVQDEKAWGRPVDVLIAPDGSLLVSDDQAGAVYRIRYTGKK